MSKEVAGTQEGVVSRFASLLGSRGKSSNPKEDIVTCFSKGVGDNVVCTVPSLDMTWGEEEGDDNPLPKVGEHMETQEPKGSAAKSSDLPVMEASVIGASEQASNAARLEQKAAQRLGTMTSWTKSSLPYCSEAIAKNVASSFSSLVDSRVRSWTLLMFRHSLSSGDAASRSRLLGMLSASIKINSAESSFKTLPLPDSAAGHHKEADVILPLLFEVVLNICLQDREDSITLRAPGTISANFSSSEELGLSKVDIRLDAGALLSSMVDQARLSVFKTVAKVTSTDIEPGVAKSTEMAQSVPAPTPTPALPSATLPSFNNALQLSSDATAQSPRLEKARSSALRLNSVLHGKSIASKSEIHSTGLRKQRSVQWDSPMELPSIRNSMPSAKKMRVVHTATRLKSFKSFGRPHADDFGSGPRNATFGDFGRKPVWGRDGRMSNHPQPMSGLERSKEDLLGTQMETSSRNASFSSFSKNTPFSSSRGKVGGGTNIPRSLPRTATALESWLMNATSSK